MSVYVVPTHIEHVHDPTRDEERERRAARARSARAPTAARLRAVQAHRLEIERRPHVPRCLALSPALPNGEARPHRGTLGREGRTTTTPLLSHHGCRQARARKPSAKLE